MQTRSRWAEHSPGGDQPMTETVVDPELEEFAQQIADQVESFLVALQAIAHDADGGRGISLLLLEVSQVLLAGARLGVQADFSTAEEFQPDAGPDPDLDEMRLRLARMLDGVDIYAEVFDTYGEPEIVTRSEEHTSELQSLMRISYAVYCLTKQTKSIIQVN